MVYWKLGMCDQYMMFFSDSVIVATFSRSSTLGFDSNHRGKLCGADDPFCIIQRYAACYVALPY